MKKHIHLIAYICLYLACHQFTHADWTKAVDEYIGTEVTYDIGGSRIARSRENPPEEKEGYIIYQLFKIPEKNGEVSFELPSPVAWAYVSEEKKVEFESRYIAKKSLSSTQDRFAAHQTYHFKSFVRLKGTLWKIDDTLVIVYK